MARKVSYEDMLQNLRDIIDDLENNELTLDNIIDLDCRVRKYIRNKWC